MKSSSPSHFVITADKNREFLYKKEKKHTGGSALYWLYNGIVDMCSSIWEPSEPEKDGLLIAWWPGLCYSYYKVMPQLKKLHRTSSQERNETEALSKEILKRTWDKVEMSGCQQKTFSEVPGKLMFLSLSLQQQHLTSISGGFLWATVVSFYKHKQWKIETKK